MKRSENHGGSEQSHENQREAEIRRSLNLSLTVVVVLIVATAGALFTLTPDFERSDRVISEVFR